MGTSPLPDGIANSAKTQARQIFRRSEHYGNSRNELDFLEVLFFTIIPTESLLTTERNLTGRENREMGVKRKRLIVSRQPIFY